MRTRAFTALLVVATAVAPAAEAKFALSLSLSEPRPALGERVRIAVRTDTKLASARGLRLVAVPPGIALYEALRRERRFRIALIRTGPRAWRASVRFRRTGTWRLVVPNWGAPGYTMPPPVVRSVRVRPRR